MLCLHSEERTIRRGRIEMKLEMKGTGDINSGIQYRGWIVQPAPPRAI